jgi:hypothetical protein
MHKFHRDLEIFGLLLIIVAVDCLAAPLPPFAPVKVAGRIKELSWVAEKQSPAMPGMSGSAGQNRTFPAHFTLKLVDFNGVSAVTAQQMTRYIDWHALKELPENAMPPFILLRIDHADKNLLKKGMTVRVDGYTVQGDEGGTWTSYSRLEVLHGE